MMGGVSDEAANKHMGDAVAEIIKANGSAHGDYLITCEATGDEDGWMYTWRWAWSPKAPEFGGRGGG
jgi:hypothetical protein